VKIENLRPQDVGYLDKVLLDEKGLVRVLPAEDLRRLDPEHLRLWLHWNAVYQLPTVELVEWLRERIGVRGAIEIGSGNGAIGRALGIPRTDNRCQEWPDVRAYYALTGQPTIRYPDDVEKIPALDAIAKYKPKVVVACWVTHLYREDEHKRGGNMYGVDEDKVIETVETYIHVGSTTSHSKKRILKRPHEEVRPLQPTWLFGRGAPEDRVIWVWETKR